MYVDASSAKIVIARSYSPSTRKARPLEALYPVVYLDALVVKVRDGAVVKNRAAHVAVGLDMEGVKHVLGIWVQATEGAKFWGGVCSELSNRGVRDVLIHSELHRHVTITAGGQLQEQLFGVGAVVLAEAAGDERWPLPTNAHARLIRVLPAEADAGGVGVQLIETHAELARHGDDHVRDERLVICVTGS